MGWRALLGITGVCALGLAASERAFYASNVGGDRHILAVGFARAGFSYFDGVAIFSGAAAQVQIEGTGLIYRSRPSGGSVPPTGGSRSSSP